MNNGVAMTGIVAEETKDTVKLQVAADGYVELDRSSVANVRRQTAAQNRQIRSGWGVDQPEPQPPEEPAREEPAPEPAPVPQTAPGRLTLYEGEWRNPEELQEAQRLDAEQLGTGRAMRPWCRRSVLAPTTQAMDHANSTQQRIWANSRVRLHLAHAVASRRRSALARFGCWIAPRPVHHWRSQAVQQPAYGSSYRRVTKIAHAVRRSAQPSGDEPEAAADDRSDDRSADRPNSRSYSLRNVRPSHQPKAPTYYRAPVKYYPSKSSPKKIVHDGQ